MSDEERLREAMRQVSAATSWYISVHGQVSRDDMKSALNSIATTLADVRDILNEHFGPEWTEVEEMDDNF